MLYWLGDEHELATPCAPKLRLVDGKMDLQLGNVHYKVCSKCILATLRFVFCFECINEVINVYINLTITRAHHFLAVYSYSVCTYSGSICVYTVHTHTHIYNLFFSLSESYLRPQMLSGALPHVNSETKFHISVSFVVKICKQTTVLSVLWQNTNNKAVFACLEKHSSTYYCCKIYSTKAFISEYLASTYTARTEKKLPPLM